MTLFYSAKIDKGHPAVLIDNSIDSQALSNHLHYLHLSRVQRVALDNTVCRPAILQKPCTMKRAYRRFMGNPRDDNFSTAGITGHEMGLHQPDDDAEISLEKAAVEPDLHAA